MAHMIKSTTVEIILYYLTLHDICVNTISTTVEIILYYLTDIPLAHFAESTTVEIILYYLTIIFPRTAVYLQQ